MARFISNCLEFLTLAGFLAAVLGVYQGLKVGPNYMMNPLFFVGIGVMIVAGIPWAHTPNKKWLKAALLGLIGFAVGGTAGGFAGEALRPHERDNLGEIVYIFAGIWGGGLCLATLSAWWAIWFHRRYKDEAKLWRER